MNKTNLFGLIGLAMALAGCGNQPVAVAGDVSYVGAKGTETTDQLIHINESNTQGAISAVQPQTSQKNVIIPEKATAICNDGTFSMSLLNEACLNNGGVKEAISRYYSE